VLPVYLLTMRLEDRNFLVTLIHDRPFLIFSLSLFSFSFLHCPLLSNETPLFVQFPNPAVSGIHLIVELYVSMVHLKPITDSSFEEGQPTTIARLVLVLVGAGLHGVWPSLYTRDSGPSELRE